MFITGNGRKTTEKDTELKKIQMEMNTMENGKTTTEQEQESANMLLQAESKKVIGNMTNL